MNLKNRFKITIKTQTNLQKKQLYKKNNKKNRIPENNLKNNVKNH